jgi:hypothetical protein
MIFSYIARNVAQSFITSWSIIERWISELWRNSVLPKEDLPNGRKENS